MTGTPELDDVEAHAEPRWLNDVEAEAWIPLLRLVNLLPQALDKQLREQAGINHVHYALLATLSNRPDRQMPLTELAQAAMMSQSRASHAVTALQDRGWVIRQPCPDDKRVQLIRLTDDGMSVLEQHAPGHVAEVRRLVFDQLDRQDLADLRRVSLKILAVFDD